MILSVYLHRDRVDILKMFGNLSDVINKILDASDEGHFDIGDKPEAPSREGAGRYNINVTNENYIQMLNMFGIKNKKISLRKLIYWFVDNEIYVDLDWEQINDYIDDKDLKCNKQVDKILNELDKLSFIVKNDGVISHAKDLIETLRR